ncbi:hypothetical protein [Fulvivirga lutea]|uniref:DUF4252 domain-containing protein n=1 Tax=Fulvivirga lutea TaxID=2810512 RepID=A0A974WHC1_9BACT|nr:hypothetical protein [Fulvivirga lutea]QSE98533.1 hypothetical protein JR347_05490 [Fulvivirga lutea]
MKSLFTTMLLLSFGMMVIAQEKAADYKELQKSIPSTIKGYQLVDEIEGSSFEMSGMSYSTASARYEKGDSQLEIAIMDYQGASALYTSAAMAWSAGMKYEDDEQKAYGVSYDNAQGWLAFQKEDNTSELVVGFKERYIITVMVTEATENQAEEIYKQLNLNNLP